MKRIALAFFLCLVTAPAFAVCPATLQLKDNAGVTPTAKYNDDGAGNCMPSVVLCGSGSANSVAVQTAGADGASNTASGLQIYSRPSWWNGATWDREAGDATNGAFVNVKASVLPTGAATAAKQPALGTAGTPSTDVLTVQGSGSGTPVPVSAAQATVTAGNSLNAVVANTTGTSVPVTGYGAALFNVNCSVNCTGGTTIQFQASDVVGFQSVGAMPVAGGSAMVTSVVNQSGSAFFCVPNMGYTNMRTNVASYSAGTVSVTITQINAASCDVAQIANALAVLADEAVFTQGTTSITPIGCLFINSYTAITTGHAGVLSCTSAGSLHTTVDNSNANGQATMAASSPVVIASNQSQVPVDTIVTPSNSFTRPANTTAYASGQLVANSVTAGSVVPLSWTAARVSGGNFYIRRVRMTLSSKSVTLTSFRIHFYTVTPTIANGDGAAWSTTLANYVCKMDVPVASWEAGTDVSIGFGLPTSGDGNECNVVASTQTLFALVEARAAYVPASGETVTVIPEIHQN